MLIKSGCARSYGASALNLCYDPYIGYRFSSGFRNARIHLAATIINQHPHDADYPDITTVQFGLMLDLTEAVTLPWGGQRTLAELLLISDEGTVVRIPDIWRLLHGYQPLHFCKKWVGYQDVTFFFNNFEVLSR